MECMCQNEGVLIQFGDIGDIVYVACSISCADTICIIYSELYSPK